MNIDVINNLPGESLTKYRIKTAFDALTEGRPLSIKEKIALNLYLGGGEEDVSTLPKEELISRINNLSGVVNEMNYFTLVNNYDNSSFVVGQLVNLKVDVNGKDKDCAMLINIELLVLSTTERQAGNSPLNVLFNYQNKALIIEAIETGRRSIFNKKSVPVKNLDELSSLPEKYLNIENEELIFYTPTETIAVYKSEDGEIRVKIIKNGEIIDSDMGALSLIFI